MEEEYPDGIDAGNFDRSYFHDTKDALAVINYTSGSTGMSKGVMISYGNLWSNARYATDNIKFFEPGDGMVSMLPLAHMFGMLVEPDISAAQRVPHHISRQGAIAQDIA